MRSMCLLCVAPPKTVARQGLRRRAPFSSSALFVPSRSLPSSGSGIRARTCLAGSRRQAHRHVHHDGPVEIVSNRIAPLVIQSFGYTRAANRSFDDGSRRASEGRDTPSRPEVRNPISCAQRRLGSPHRRLALSSMTERVLFHEPATNKL